MYRPSWMSAEQATFEEYLLKQGFKVPTTCSLGPIEVQANHVSGISIFFYCRPDVAWIAIHNRHGDYDDMPDKRYMIFKAKIKSSFETCDRTANWSEAFYAFYLLWSDVKDFVSDDCTLIQESN